MPAEQPDLKCPKCGSADLSGLMASFYVKLDGAGSPVGSWEDWESDTELTGRRLCDSCGCEFDCDDDPEVAQCLPAI